MKINDDLRLVLDIGNYHAYHTPISTDVYESNFLILSGTQGTLFSRGIKHALSVGQRIAALTLRDEGKRIAEERDRDDDFGASAFLKEIKRLTTILAPTSEGWNFLPVEMAIQQNKIDEDDWKEVESAIVFFTCAYYSLPKRERPEVLPLLMEAMGGQNTSLSCEEYAASLPTPTKTDKKKASSIPT